MEWFAAPGEYAPAMLPPALYAVQNVGPLRLASAAYATAPSDDPGNVAWRPAIYGDITVQQSAMDAIALGGRLALGVAAVDVADADGSLLGPIMLGTADGRAATVRVVPVSDARSSNFGSPLGSAMIAFRGVVQRVTHIEGSRARITITDAAERLAVALQSTRYGGTGGMDGPASLKDKPKPVAIGSLFNISPVPLGDFDLGEGVLPTFQINSRAVLQTYAVRIRGVEQVEVFSAPGVGEFMDFPAVGAFQIGSTPDGDVTCDAYGDNVGGYVESTAGVVRRLVQAFGPQLADADLQIGTFDFAETDLPGPVRYYQGAEETTTAAAIDTLLAGCGAILCGGRDGTLRLVDPLVQGAAQFLLPMGLILALEPVDLPATLRPLPWAVGVSWRPNGTVQTNLAGSVERADFGSASSGPARSESASLNAWVAQRRELRFPGLYADEGDAQARAAQWLAFAEAGPRVFNVTTDRYLGQIEVGMIGAIAYPQFGLDAGAGVVVLGYQEALAGRRVTLTVCTVPWVTYPAVDTSGSGLGWFILDTDELG